MKKDKLLHSLRKYIFKIAATLAVVVLVAGYLATREKSTASNGSTQTSYTITVGDVEDIVTAQGKLEPKEYVDVGTQVSGQLKKLYVDIGNIVKKDDVLAEIDPRIYETKVEADRAKLKSLEAQLNEQRAQYILT